MKFTDLDVEFCSSAVIIHITDDVCCDFQITDGMIEGTYPEVDSVVSHCDVNINTKYGFVMVYKKRCGLY